MTKSTPEVWPNGVPPAPSEIDPELITDDFTLDPPIEFSDDEFTIPTDPLIEVDDVAFPDNPEMQAIFDRANAGQFQHTMFEAWADVLDAYVNVIDHGVTMPLAQGLLKQYPWLKYSDIDGYLVSRRAYLVEAKRILQTCYPKPEEELFQENENDFPLHKEAYLDVIVAWTRYSNRLVAKWDAIPMKNQSQKGVQHAVIADLSALLINPKDGLVENLRNLAGFHDVMSDEDGDRLVERINSDHDETDDR